MDWASASHLSLPLFVAPNSLLVMGGEDQRPDYDYADQFTVHIFEINDGKTLMTTIPDLTGAPAATVTATRGGGKVVVDVRTVDDGSHEPGAIARKWSVVLHRDAKSMAQEARGERIELGEQD